MTGRVLSDHSRIILDPLYTAYTSFPYVTAVSVVAVCMLAKSQLFPSERGLSLPDRNILLYIYKKFPLVMHSRELVTLSDRAQLAYITHKIIFNTIDYLDDSLSISDFSYNTQYEIQEIWLSNPGSEERQQLKNDFSDKIHQNVFSDERINLCWKLAVSGYRPISLISYIFLFFSVAQMGLAHENYPMYGGNSNIFKIIRSGAVVFNFAFFTFFQMLVLMRLYKISCQEKGEEYSLSANRYILYAISTASIAGWYFPLLALDRSLVPKAMTKITLFPYFVSALIAANITTIVLSMLMSVDRISKASRVILLAGYAGAYIKLWNRYVQAIQKNTF